MTRYVSQITVVSDTTSKAAWNCTRDLRTAQGACVFQLTGGAGGCATGSGGTSNGCCCLWTVPNNVNNILIELWGGGGGGGAPVNCICCLAGGGGGGGAYSRKVLAVTPGSQYTLCVGAGGAGGIPSSSTSVCCCGQKGGTTYVTGTGLTSFCAEGGYGGESRCRPSGTGFVSPNGGWPGSGGQLNVRGGDGGMMGSRSVTDWVTGFSFGGHSPFGGRQTLISYDDCARYSDWNGTGRAGGPCGFTGSFPGGGGTGGWPNCCCGICVCGGCGAPGLIRIWM